MTPFLRIHALPASCGDCLWIEYGGDDSSPARRILVDGGKIGSYEALYRRVAKLPAYDNAIRLLVVTHVDADHIEGIVALLTDARLRLNLGQIWFNGWKHIDVTDAPVLGAVQGEFLSALLQQDWSDRWNYDWREGGSSGRIVVEEGVAPPTKAIDGLSLTLLSPDRERLDELRKAWQVSVSSAGVRPGDITAALRLLKERHRRLMKGPVLGSPREDWKSLLATPFAEDDRANNGSSLAFLAEFAGLRCLLLGDAFPSVIRASLARISGARRFPVGLMKVAHHGSRYNTDAALLEAVDCRHFLFTTDGSTFGHPDEECVMRVVAHSNRGVHLYFNYDHRSRAVFWNDPERQRELGFIVHYPPADTEGICVDVPRTM